MDEREWLACTDPDLMLDFLQAKVSDRKLRLFTCACCRQVWDLLSLEGRKAVETVEGYADLRLTADTLAKARAEARKAAKDAPKGASTAAGWSAAYWVTWFAAQETARAESRIATAALRASCAIRVSLLRDIAGNPFHAVAIDPTRLLWHGNLIRRLAQAAYDEPQLPSGHLVPERLAVLADALEEAGCQDQDILGHLRQPGAVHARGCHIVDLCLGRS